MKGLRTASLLLAAIAFCFVSLSASPYLALASGSTYYLDSVNGNDANSGTSPSAAWQTPQKAASTILSGDTVILASGIYQPPGVFNFGPAGTPGNLTTFKAASGARPIFTSPSNYPPVIGMLDYVRLDGLWFGGLRNVTVDQGIRPGGSPMGYGKEIINCTIFNFIEGISVGSAQYYLIQGNRFVNTGYTQFHHGVYLSGNGKNPRGAASTHVIVDNNILIGGEGFGIQDWHLGRDMILTRNFITQHTWGTVTDSSDHLIANNFTWKLKGGFGEQPYGVWVDSTHTIVFNNVAEVDGWLNDGFPGEPSNLFSNNAFSPGPYPNGVNFTPRGANIVMTTPGQEQAEYGISANDIDRAIAALQTSFAQSPNAILNDQTIEPNFAKLKLRIPQGSPLYMTGRNWFGTGPMNIGPDAPAPADQNGFWTAFRALGLRDWDRFGNCLNCSGTPTATPTSTPTRTATTAPPTNTSTNTPTNTPINTPTNTSTNTPNPSSHPCSTIWR
jgi:hypothetical protein